MYYAQLDENSIAYSIIETHQPLSGNGNILIQSFDSSILGKKWQNNVWVDVPQVLPKYCTVLEFRSKFTTEEKVAIYTAANSNVLIKIWLDDLAAVQNNIVNLEDERTIASVEFLESSGIIATGRANIILER